MESEIDMVKKIEEKTTITEVPEAENNYQPVG